MKTIILKEDEAPYYTARESGTLVVKSWNGRLAEYHLEAGQRQYVELSYEPQDFKPASVGLPDAQILFRKPSFDRKPRQDAWYGDKVMVIGLCEFRPAK